jgi:hypothetical protein
MNEITGTMYMRFGSSKKLYQVSSLMEAARKFAEAEKKAHEMLIFKTQPVAILDANFDQIARISPNGRVWDMNEKVVLEAIRL